MGQRRGAGGEQGHGSGEEVSGGTPAGEPAAAEAAAGPKVIFRNYQPSDTSLQESAKLPRAGVVKPAVPVKAADDDNVLKVIAKK